MELVYLWVEDYKNIQKQGFNFSPRFTCEYDEDSKELTIDKNDDYIPDFFGENINVTAIVGKNGSGKSNLLELVSKKIESINKTKTLKLFYNSKETKFYIASNQKIDINFCNKKVNFNYQEYHEVIYYSDTFSENSILNNEAKNISFSHMLHISDYNEFVEEFYELTKLILEEIKSYEILLIKKLNFIPGISKLPTHIIISFNLFNDEIDTTNDFIHFAIELLICLFEGNLEDEISYNIKTFNDLKKQILNSNNDKLLAVFQNLELFLEEYEKILKYTIEDKNEGILLIPIPKVSEKFIKAIEKVFLEKKNRFMIRLEWNHSLSTGEEVFLRFYALLYKSIKENNYKIKNFILLIDELDNFLHPSWQSKIIKLIIEFLKLIKLKNNTQIILTSHSPFLISDIPKQNIIFLDKDEKGNCKVVDGLKEKKQTFGANIHTLLSDSFFMEDGLMGEFAKDKINEIIDFFKGKNEIYQDNKKKLKKTIQAIGEPFLKDKLLRMYDEKYPKTKEEMIAEYEAEIEKLKND